MGDTEADQEREKGSERHCLAKQLIRREDFSDQISDETVGTVDRRTFIAK